MKHSRLLLCGLLCLSLQTTASYATEPVTPQPTEQKFAKHNEDYIKTRMKLIYALVFNSVETGHYAIADYFFSDEFRALYETAESLTPYGEIGFYDFDPWVRTQNYTRPCADIVKAYDITMKSALVDVVVYPTSETENAIEVKVRLRFEHGDWFVADFNNDLNGLQRYVSNLQ